MSGTKPSDGDTVINCRLGGVIVALGDADTLTAGVRDDDVVLVADDEACADNSEDADIDADTNTLDDGVALIDVVADGSPLTLGSMMSTVPAAANTNVSNV